MAPNIQDGQWFDWETGEWLVDPKTLLADPVAAAMIAAAPKMYATLKTLVTEVRAYSSPEVDENEITGPILAAADEALKLIDPTHEGYAPQQS